MSVSLKHIQTSHKSHLLCVGAPQGGCAKNTYTHVHALCGNTVFLPNRAVHKLRNKPKFTKPHKEINVCRLWVYLHSAPPRKRTRESRLPWPEPCAYNTVLLCFGYPESVTRCWFGYHWTTVCKSFVFPS